MSSCRVPVASVAVLLLQYYADDWLVVLLLQSEMHCRSGYHTTEPELLWVSAA